MRLFLNQNQNTKIPTKIIKKKFDFLLSFKNIRNQQTKPRKEEASCVIVLLIWFGEPD